MGEGINSSNRPKASEIIRPESQNKSYSKIKKSNYLTERIKGNRPDSVE